MKRFLVAASAAVSIFTVLCGCSDKDKQLSEPPVQSSADLTVEIESMTESVTDHSSQEETQVSSEPENHELERKIQPAEGTYVYDYAGVLSDDAFDECNNYAEWLYETFLINTAVVITDDIEELTPEQYAEDAYIELYGGRGSGLLLLINNDTNKDYLYKTGSCLVSISEETQANEFYWATQEIISGDYKSAILRLLKVGEVCPQHIFDNGGIFTTEEIANLEESCTGGINDISILATNNSTGSANEDICRSYYERHYQSADGVMIMLDTATKTLTVVSDSDINDYDVTLEQANALAAAGDYTGALNSLITVLKG